MQWRIQGRDNFLKTESPISQGLDDFPPLISRTGSDSEGGDQNERGNDVIDSYDSDGMENWD